MILNALYNREAGYRGTFSLDTILEDFRCSRIDNHCVEGQEFGDLIPPLACSFSKVDPHVLAVADEEGGLVIYDVNRKGPHAVLQDWLAHTNAIFDMEWIPSESKLLTASGDQTVALWDIAAEEKLVTFRGHMSSVKTVRHRPNDRFVFATGARDGHIMVWDQRMKQADACMQPQLTVNDAHKCTRSSAVKRKRHSTALDSHQSVTAVLFQDEHTLISSGSVDSCVKMWDLRRLHSVQKSGATPKHTFSYAGKSVRAHGFSSLTLDSSSSRLFASCTDNTIYQYDCAGLSTNSVFSYRGHTNSTFYVKSALSPDDDYLLSGSSDGNAYIWRVGDCAGCSHGLVTLQGHTGEVSGVAWCANDFGKIVTLGDDNAMRFWRLMRRPESGVPTGADDLIGWTEPTRRAIGVSVHTASPRLATILMSPRKGTTVPLSPAKVSPAVRSSLATLTDGRRSEAMTTHQSARGTNWFGNAPPCIQCASPRRLQVTPTKSSPVKYTQDTQGKQRAKRKLCDDDSASHDDAMPKRLRSSPLVNAQATVSLPESARKSLFSPKHRQSLTVDMPNYVLDPRPRTPVGKLQDATPRTPDWLTLLKEQRASPATSSPVVASPRGAVKTPRQSKRRLDVFTTPSPPPASSRRRVMTPSQHTQSPLSSGPSIKNYFSPKSLASKATK